MGFSSFKSYGTRVAISQLEAPTGDVLDYNFRIKGNNSTTPTMDFDGKLQLFNTGNVAMINDSTRGYVFYFSGFNYLNVNFQNPQIFTRTFWLSSNSANLSSGNVFSSKSYPLFFDQNKLLNISFGSETTFVQSATWTHYTVVKNTDTTVLYIDGFLYQTFSQTYTLDTNLLIVFGAYINGNNSNYTGYIDDMRLYPKALTANEVSRIYNNTYIAAKVKVITSFMTVGQTSFVMPSDVTEIEILIVGGGGGGGASIGGGGGAGGFGYFSNYSVIPNNEYNIVVGYGGAGDTTVQRAPTGLKGGDSSFSDLIIHGGGAGREFQGTTSILSNGASGGGGSYASDAGGTSISGEGNDGGSHSFIDPQYFGGGGGGAGEKGNTNSNTINPHNHNGGDGKISSISGVSTYYCGGGGGGSLRSSIPYTNNGGLGGGGQGEGSVGSQYYSRPILSMDGAPNTGGGGGGRAEDGDFTNILRGGNGGSGIVIITYLTST